MGVVTDFRDERPRGLRLLPAPLATAAQEIIDLPTLRPEQERVVKLIGSGIGIAAVYVVAGAIWAYRGVAWCVRRLRALPGPAGASERPA